MTLTLAPPRALQAVPSRVSTRKGRGPDTWGAGSRWGSRMQWKCAALRCGSRVMKQGTRVTEIGAHEGGYGWSQEHGGGLARYQEGMRGRRQRGGGGRGDRQKEGKGRVHTITYHAHFTALLQQWGDTVRHKLQHVHWADHGGCHTPAPQKAHNRLTGGAAIELEHKNSGLLCSRAHANARKREHAQALKRTPQSGQGP